MLRGFSLEQPLDHRPVHHVVRRRGDVAEVVDGGVVVAHPGKRAQPKLADVRRLGAIGEHVMLLSHADDYAAPPDPESMRTP